MIDARPSIRDQIDRLGVDLATLRDFVERKSPHVRGVALATAHAVLILAVSPVVDMEEQFVREDILADAVVALDRAGLGHVGPLVAAALTCDALAASIAPSVERPQ